METNRPNPDEIDLLHLLVRLYRLLIQNWLFIFLIVGACVGISLFSFKNAAQIFESKMVVRSEFLSESNATQIIDNLQNLSSENNDSLFAARLNLSAPDAQKVKKISVKSSLNSGAVATELDKTVFLIVAEISDPSVLPKLQQGLLSFFDSNEFLKSRVVEKKKGYQNLIAQIDNEIAGLGNQPAGNDPGNLYLSRQPKGKDSRNMTSLQFDPSTVRVFMYKDRIETEEKLTFLRGVEVMDGFTAPHLPVKPRLLVFITSGVTSGILLSLLFLGIRTFNRLTKKYPV